MTRVPPIAVRVETLFRVWELGDRGEQSNADVAERISRRGRATSPDELVSLRSGAVEPDEALLVALADEFDVPRSYLVDDEVSAVHDQLLLMEAIARSGVKQIYLRGEGCDVNRGKLIDVLRSCAVGGTDTALTSRWRGTQA